MIQKSRLIIVSFTFIALFFIVSGCGTIRSHRNIEQPIDITLTTGIGGTIFRLNKLGDLPNAFGGRDIWGGKVDKGYAEMKLSSIDGKVLSLEVIDFNKQTHETTMDRYKPFQNRSATVNVESESKITIEGTKDTRPYVIKFDTEKQKDIVISGVRVTFIDIQPYSVSYTLEDVMP
jgi:hypothetical protein